MKSIHVAVALTCLFSLPITAQAADGEKLYNKHCKKCHTFEPDKHGLGPSLAGVIGNKAGQTSFTKYKVLKDSDIVWDDANLDGWIEDPKKFIGQNTTMVVKVKKDDERAAIIEYMKSQ